MHYQQNVQLTSMSSYIAIGLTAIFRIIRWRISFTDSPFTASFFFDDIFHAMKFKVY